MSHFYNSNIQQEQFDRNLADWCKGGPSPEGWTRLGPTLPIPKIVLVEHRLELIRVEDVLAKNADQVKSWHINFLFSKQPEWEETKYCKEYLLPRCEEPFRRMQAFARLFANIRVRGVLKPVFVAEVDGFPFRYFRFDGCHRASCVSALGLDKIPTRVFKTKTLYV